MTNHEPSTDWYGIVLQFLASVVTLSILPSPMAYCLMKLDPLNHIILYCVKVYFPNYDPSIFVLALVTFVGYVVSQIIVFEIFRSLILVLAILSVGCRVWLEYFRRLKLLDSRQTFIWNLIKIKVIYASISGIVESAIAFLMTFGVIVSVISNVCSLKLYSVIPLAFYVWIPVISVVTIIIIVNLIPAAVNIHESSKKGISLKKKDAGSYWKRKLGAQRPFVLCTGVLDYRFFEMKQSTKLVYYFALLENTVNVLISLNEFGV